MSFEDFIASLLGGVSASLSTASANCGSGEAKPPSAGYGNSTALEGNSMSWKHGRGREHARPAMLTKSRFVFGFCWGTVMNWRQITNLALLLLHARHMYESNESLTVI